MCERNKTVLRSNWLLQKICRYLKSTDETDQEGDSLPECQKSFELLKSYLCGEPILKYADTSKTYTLYTDASKYSWVGVLTQSCTIV